MNTCSTGSAGCHCGRAEGNLPPSSLHFSLPPQSPFFIFSASLPIPGVLTIDDYSNGFYPKSLVQTKQLHQLQLLLLCDFSWVFGRISPGWCRAPRASFRFLPPVGPRGFSLLPRKAFPHFAVVLGSCIPTGEVISMRPLRSFQRMLSTHRKVPLPMAEDWSSRSFKVPFKPNHSGVL